MKRWIHFRTAPWIGGTLLALSGVLIARGAAPHAAGEPRGWIVLSGELLSLGGLCWIAFGVHRRLRQETPPTK